MKYRLIARLWLTVLYSFAKTESETPRLTSMSPPNICPKSGSQEFTGTKH